MASEPTDGGLSVGQRIGQLETAVIGVSNRVDKLEQWRDDFAGRLDLIVAIGKWLIGGSAVSLLIGVITLIILVTGANPK